MRTMTAALALTLGLGTATTGAAQTQQDPFSAFFRALATDFDRAARKGFRPYLDEGNARNRYDDDHDDDDDDDDDDGVDDDDDDDGAGGGDDDDDDD